MEVGSGLSLSNFCDLQKIMEAVCEKKVMNIVLSQKIKEIRSKESGTLWLASDFQYT